MGMQEAQLAQSQLALQEDSTRHAQEQQRLGADLEEVSGGHWSMHAMGLAFGSAASGFLVGAHRPSRSLLSIAT